MSKSGRARRLVSMCNTTINTVESLTHYYLSDSDSELTFDQSSDEEYTPYNKTVQSENESSDENSNDEGCKLNVIHDSNDDTASLIINDVNDDVINQQQDLISPSTRGGRKKVGDELQTRKRTKNIDSWAKNKRKQLKTQGKEYCTVKGKTISAKSMKVPCKCKRKCYEKVNEDQRLLIFNNFYSLTLDSQNQFIAGSINEYPKKTQRLKYNHNKPSRRQFSKQYFLKKCNEKIEVCQVMFMNTLDISLKKMRVIMSKKRSMGDGVCSIDGRGRQLNHPSLSDEEKNIIRDHIKMFPIQTSHYSNKNYFLNLDLSLSAMYTLYKNYCSENNFFICSEFIYRKIFVEESNLGFKKPNNDTCQQCDKYTTLLKCCTNDLEQDQIAKEKDTKRSKKIKL